MLETIVAVFLVLGAAPAPQKVEPFAGTWIAEFKGTVWIRLELSASAGSLRGRLAIGDMEVDTEGRVKAAQKAPDQGSPVLDIVVRDSTLAFARKDGADTDRFQLRLVDGEAELSFVLDEATRKALMDDGVPPPKPVRLRRQ